MTCMQLLYRLLDGCRKIVRRGMHRIAVALNHMSGGHISPNMITLVGLSAHIPIAYCIAIGQFTVAAVLLVVFGLFDTLDGELARLQHTSSSAGMVLDASTDRMKEVMLYAGVAYALSGSSAVVWAVTACGASLCVSYIKAKGETAVSDQNLTPNQINRLFQDGLARFEVRMVLLIIGLLTGQLVPVLILITILAVYTAFSRLITIMKVLN